MSFLSLPDFPHSFQIPGVFDKERQDRGALEKFRGCILQNQLFQNQRAFLNQSRSLLLPGLTQRGIILHAILHTVYRRFTDLEALGDFAIIDVVIKSSPNSTG